MRIKDLMADWLCDTSLFEMAYQRKKAIEFVSNYQRQIARHIIKYFYYDASDETKKHWVMNCGVLGIVNIVPLIQSH